MSKPRRVKAKVGEESVQTVPWDSHVRNTRHACTGQGRAMDAYMSVRCICQYSHIVHTAVCLAWRSTEGVWLEEKSVDGFEHQAPGPTHPVLLGSSRTWTGKTMLPYTQKGPNKANLPGKVYAPSREAGYI